MRIDNRIQWKKGRERGRPERWKEGRKPVSPEDEFCTWGVGGLRWSIVRVDCLLTAPWRVRQGSWADAESFCRSRPCLSGLQSASHPSRSGDVDLPRQSQTGITLTQTPVTDGAETDECPHTIRSALARKEHQVKLTSPCSRSSHMRRVQEGCAPHFRSENSPSSGVTHFLFHSLPLGPLSTSLSCALLSSYNLSTSFFFLWGPPFLALFPLPGRLFHWTLG